MNRDFLKDFPDQYFEQTYISPQVPRVIFVLRLGVVEISDNKQIGISPQVPSV